MQIDWLQICDPLLIHRFMFACYWLHCMRNWVQCRKRTKRDGKIIYDHWLAHSCVVLATGHASKKPRPPSKNGWTVRIRMRAIRKSEIDSLLSVVTNRYTVEFLLYSQCTQSVHLPRVQMGKRKRICLWFGKSVAFPRQPQTKWTYIPSENVGGLPQRSGENWTPAQYNDSRAKWKFHRKWYLPNFQHVVWWLKWLHHSFQFLVGKLERDQNQVLSSAVCEYMICVFNGRYSVV